LSSVKNDAYELNHDVLSQRDINKLSALLPMSAFLEGVVYGENENKDGRAFNAPVAYAGLSPRAHRATTV